jgi:hypothetical protein
MATLDWLLVLNAQLQSQPIFAMICLQVQRAGRIDLRLASARAPSKRKVAGHTSASTANRLDTNKSDSESVSFTRPATSNTSSKLKQQVLRNAGYMNYCKVPHPWIPDRLVRRLQTPRGPVKAILPSPLLNRLQSGTQLSASALGYAAWLSFYSLFLLRWASGPRLDS